MKHPGQVRPVIVGPGPGAIRIRRPGERTEVSARGYLLEVLNCTRDEGRPLGLGLQGLGPNHRMLLQSNGRGGERSRKRRE